LKGPPSCRISPSLVRLLVEEVIEEAFDLVRVHRTIQIRRDSRVVDPFSLVVWSALLVPLEEDRDSLLLHIGLPIVVEHPEDVSRHCRLLAKGEVDHGKQRPFALIDAAEEKRLHGALDIGRVEGGRHHPGVGRLVLLFGSFRWINHVLLLFSLLRSQLACHGCSVALADSFCESRPLPEKFAHPLSGWAIHFHCQEYRWTRLGKSLAISSHLTSHLTLLAC